MTFTGRVEQLRVARGTKSEHVAVVLRVEGRALRLRRRGGHAYDDPVLARLVGKTITCEGTVHGHALIIDRWKALED
jgi:hypothetical protein